MSKPDREDKEPIFGTHWGDLGTIVIAFLLTLVGAAMFFVSFHVTSSAPQAAPKAQPAPAKAETDMLLFTPQKK
jgi:hypothetical protein